MKGAKGDEEEDDEEEEEAVVRLHAPCTNGQPLKQEQQATASKAAKKKKAKAKTKVKKAAEDEAGEGELRVKLAPPVTVPPRTPAQAAAAAVAAAQQQQSGLDEIDQLVRELNLTTVRDKGAGMRHPGVHAACAQGERLCWVPHDGMMVIQACGRTRALCMASGVAALGAQDRAARTTVALALGVWHSNG